MHIHDINRKVVLAAMSALFLMACLLTGCSSPAYGPSVGTELTNFNQRWEFHKGDMDSTVAFTGNEASINPKDSSLWTRLTLPHDWSIEDSFDVNSPATNQGGALSGGIGWYRKTFVMPSSDSAKHIQIRFDGIYRHSKVWINGHFLGYRPNGFISFTYSLTPYLYFDERPNVLVVRVDNSEQPNARWYTGSGINRDVWLIKKGPMTINQQESFFYASVRTDSVQSNDPDDPKTKQVARLTQELVLDFDQYSSKSLQINSTIYDKRNLQVAHKSGSWKPVEGESKLIWEWDLEDFKFWSPEDPYLYTWEVEVRQGSHVIDRLRLPLGIRKFRFDSTKGFFLNGQPTKIKGVCLHSDWGAMGTAYNYSAMLRQLKLLKEMGCNAIRTAHNPPAPGMLSLCDSMGFLVMDEAFDAWQKKKTKYDYSQDFAEWHKKDLEALIKRDRNHPSVFMWSIGNEIREQFDTSGIRLTKELVAIVKGLDETRPVTAGLTEMEPEKNNIVKADALDVLGFNYKSDQYDLLPKRFPGKSFIASETVSALETRGAYQNMPTDSIVYMPASSKEKFAKNVNGDWTVSAYDKVAAYWGTTHENAWRALKNKSYIAGTFVWTGIDYLGEPVPYPYPARSSYYGIIDQAGLAKDIYYFYKSEWTDEPVLHVFPHWNWKPGKVVDVWAYYNQADEVELLLNGKSLGTRHKGDGKDGGNEFHVVWKVPFEPGTLEAISRKNGKIILNDEIKTAGPAIKVEANVDQSTLHGQTGDLCYVTVRLTDENGTLVPNDDRELQFSVKGPATLAGLNNGYQADLHSFKGNTYRTWKGKCVAIIRPTVPHGRIELHIKGEGLQDRTWSIHIGE